MAARFPGGCWAGCGWGRWLFCTWYLAVAQRCMQFPKIQRHNTFPETTCAWTPMFTTTPAERSNTTVALLFLKALSRRRSSSTPSTQGFFRERGTWTACVLEQGFCLSKISSYLSYFPGLLVNTCSLQATAASDYKGVAENE